MLENIFLTTKRAGLGLVLGTALAASAGAATIDFTSSGTGAGGAVGGGPLNYSTSAQATLLGFPVSASVTTTGNGLGIRSFLDTNGNQIDGSPLTASETLTVSFSWAVNLVNFTLGLLDANDDFEIAFNGGSFTHYNPGQSNPIAGQNNVTSFSIRASGTSLAQDGLLGNDDFTLKSANVAPVPLPAGGLLLLGAMGGLAALRRRKAAAL